MPNLNIICKHIPIYFSLSCITLGVARHCASPLFLFSLARIFRTAHLLCLHEAYVPETKICLKSNGISTRRSNNRSITIIQPFYKFLQLIFRRIIIFIFLFDFDRKCVCVHVLFLLLKFLHTLASIAAR